MFDTRYWRQVGFIEDPSVLRSPLGGAASLLVMRVAATGNHVLISFSIFEAPGDLSMIVQDGTDVAVGSLA